MTSTRDPIAKPAVTMEAGFQMEVLRRLQRLRDRLDEVFDEVLTQATMKRRATTNGRPRLAQAGVRS